jgi:hypothetical protein
MSATAAKVRPFAELLLCLVGPAIWSAHFMVMYGAHTLVCAGAAAGQGMHERSFPAIAAAATGVALLVLVGFMAWCLALGRQESRAQGAADQARFARQVSIMLALLSMLGTIWVALPALLVAPCASWSTQLVRALSPIQRTCALQMSVSLERAFL